LFDLGRTTADAWIATRGADIGQKSAIDLTRLLPVSGRGDPATQLGDLHV
jgi:hypothetical protein